MTSITISTKGNRTSLYTPYHPKLPSRAKKLGGKFDSGEKAWVFDARDEARVRQLALDIYGTDGTDTEIATVRIQVGNEEWVSARNQGLFLGGQLLAKAKHRDSGARPEEGVVVLEGRLGSGGSMANPVTIAEPHTVLEVRDVPRGAAERMIEAVEKTPAVDSAEIVDDQQASRAALEAERERLVARLAEIDAELEKSEPAEAQ